MKNFLHCALGLLAAFSLHASPIDATLVNVTGVNAFGYYVGPFSGKLDQQAVTFDCVDFANDAYVGEQWSVNLSHIDTQSDLANTRYGGVANSLQLYQEAAWLTEQYALNPSTAWGDIQTTIWRLFDAAAPAPSSGYWLSQAQNRYASGDYSNFFVVTNLGPVTATGQVQEFLTVLSPSMSIYPTVSNNSSPAAAIATPEPRMLGVVGLTLLCIFVVLRKRRNVSA